MENFLNTELRKKIFAEITGIDGSKNGSAWQKELKKASEICDFTNNGKSGPGIRYIILEMYNKLRKQAHGNSGRTPVNKGKVYTTSSKYKLAQALIQMSDGNTYESKNMHFTNLGLITKNLKHIEKKFGCADYSSLNTIDKLIYNQALYVETSLKRLWNGALELIKNGHFEDVTIKEKLFVARFNERHHVASKVLAESEMLYALYQMAKEEAQIVIKNQYGDKLFFAVRNTLEHKAYLKLVENDERYVALYNNKIDYFYNKFAIAGAIKADVDFKQEFFNKFTNDRKRWATKSIQKFSNAGVEGDFLSEEMMNKFADDMFQLMFENDRYLVFKEKCEELLEQARNPYEAELKRYVDEQLTNLLPKHILMKAIV
ncbi:hypothetical protein [Priestia megaterium]|uniref:hypothetical protein n=1 Tax=Priestia megaterium TaxID=1404 RepID=UPI0027954063|nr:hypothetical protein [Priestia megaterium]